MDRSLVSRIQPSPSREESCNGPHAVMTIMDSVPNHWLESSSLVKAMTQRTLTISRFFLFYCVVKKYFETQYGEQASSLKLYQKLAKLRQREEALLVGETVRDETKDGVVSFSRFSKDNGTVTGSVSYDLN